MVFPYDVVVMDQCYSYYYHVYYTCTNDVPIVVVVVGGIPFHILLPNCTWHYE